MNGGSGDGDFLGARSPLVFWRTDLHPAVLPVRAAPVADADPDAFRLDRLPCRAVIRRLGDGREQIIIGGGTHSIRLEVRAGTLLEGPVRLTYDLAGFADIDIRLQALRQFVALHRLNRLPSGLFRTEPRARRWAMALQAWDGGRAGASQREIAVALFGGARVAADWAAGDHMRKRVARLVRTGDWLVAGAGPGMLRRETS